VGDQWFETVAPAKVNLWLRIFPPGADGYHPIETLFCRIDLAETVRLRLRPEPGVGIRVTGPETAPEGPENLAVRAAELFLDRSGLGCGAEIELEKRVPSGSGLGGGSSDAAAVLRLLSSTSGSAGPGEEEVLSMAAELGADVSFFVADVPLAFAWDRGQRLFSYPPVEPRPMLLLLPPIPVSTAEAYASWDAANASAPGDERRPAVVDYATLTSWAGIAAAAENDFEPIIFGRHPQLRELRVRLKESAAIISLLSGSGSALFAVYQSERQRDAAAVRLSDELKGVRVVSARGPV
jgi:4-diphosphocytidyl-2-C-methyl-D-erythritol kinase